MKKSKPRDTIDEEYISGPSKFFWREDARDELME